MKARCGHRPIRLFVVVAMTAFGLTTAPGRVGAAQSVEPTIGPSSPVYSWRVEPGSGANVAYDEARLCGDTFADRCDERTLHVDVPESFWGDRPGGIGIRVFDYEPGANFDIYVYRLEPDGTRTPVARTGHLPENQGVMQEESTSVLGASGDYVVDVVYVGVAQSAFRAEARFLRSSEWTPRNGLEALGLVCNEDLRSNRQCNEWVGLITSWDGLTLSSNIKIPCFAPPEGSTCVTTDSPRARPAVLGLSGLNSMRGFCGPTPCPELLKLGYAAVSYSNRGTSGSCGLYPATNTNVEHPRGPGGDPTCSEGWEHYHDRDWELRDAQTFLNTMVDNGIADPGRIGVAGGSNGSFETWLLATSLPWKTALGRPMQIAAAYAEQSATDAQGILYPNGRASDHVDQAPSHERPFGVPHLAGGLGAAQRGTRPNLTKPDELHSFTAGWLAFAAAGEPYDTSNVNGITADKLAAVLRNKSAYYSDDYFAAVHARTVRRVPIFANQGWQDFLLPPVQSLQMYRKLKAADPEYPIWLAFADIGHGDKGSGLDTAELNLVHAEATRFLNHFLLDAGGELPPAEVTSFQTECDPFSEVDLRPRAAAASWDAIHPGRLVFGDDTGLVQTTSTPSGPPAVSPETAYAPCSVHGLGSGLASWSWRVRDGGFTLLGLPELSAHFDILGTDATVSAKLWDVDTSVCAGSDEATVPCAGTRRLVTRGIYRLTAAADGTEGVIDFQLDGNHWAFEQGHTLELEMAQTDLPSYRPDSLPSAITFSNVELTLPTVDR